MKSTHVKPILKSLVPALMVSLSIFLTLSSFAQAESFQKWEWQQSRCNTCALDIEVDRDELRTAKVQRFLRAIEQQKSRIVGLYKSDPQEYNLLAHMAVGILGRESLLFTSRRYELKQAAPWAVTTLKTMRALIEGEPLSTISDNSRGPTQIKDVPDKIEKSYGITTSTLGTPENAAIATMGFLIEALQELKQRAANRHLEFITPATYVDYLPYIYFGRAKALVERTANPAQNAYVQDMKRYMEWVELYEVDP